MAVQCRCCQGGLVYSTYLLGLGFTLFWCGAVLLLCLLEAFEPDIWGTIDLATLARDRRDEIGYFYNNIKIQLLSTNQ